MTCGRYVLIDRDAEDKYKADGTFDQRIKAPAMAFMKQEGCTANKVERRIIENIYTSSIEPCLQCVDEKCFPDKIEPNPQKA